MTLNSRLDRIASAMHPASSAAMFRGQKVKHWLLTIGMTEEAKRATPLPAPDPNCTGLVDILRMVDRKNGSER